MRAAQGVISKPGLGSEKDSESRGIVKKAEEGLHHGKSDHRLVFNSRAYVSEVSRFFVRCHPCELLLIVRTNFFGVKGQKSIAGFKVLDEHLAQSECGSAAKQTSAHNGDRDARSWQEFGNAKREG